MHLKIRTSTLSRIRSILLNERFTLPPFIEELKGSTSCQASKSSDPIIEIHVVHKEIDYVRDSLSKVLLNFGIGSNGELNSLGEEIDSLIDCLNDDDNDGNVLRD
jgi:hypothetical protein